MLCHKDLQQHEHLQAFAFHHHQAATRLDLQGTASRTSEFHSHVGCSNGCRLLRQHRLVPRRQGFLDQGHQVCHADSDRILRDAHGHVKRGIAFPSHRHQAATRLDLLGMASHTLEFRFHVCCSNDCKLFHQHRQALRHQGSPDQGRQVGHANSDLILHGVIGHVKRGIAFPSHRRQAAARLDPQGRVSRT